MGYWVDEGYSVPTPPADPLICLVAQSVADARRHPGEQRARANLKTLIGAGTGAPSYRSPAVIR